MKRWVQRHRSNIAGTWRFDARTKFFVGATTTGLPYDRLAEPGRRNLKCNRRRFLCGLLLLSACGGSSSRATDNGTGADAGGLAEQAGSTGTANASAGASVAGGRSSGGAGSSAGNGPVGEAGSAVLGSGGFAGYGSTASAGSMGTAGSAGAAAKLVAFVIYFAGKSSIADRV